MKAHLGSSFEVLELLILGEAPEGGAYAQVVGLAEAPGLLVDLLRQLARGGHYDGNGPPRPSPAPAGPMMCTSIGSTKRCCLA